MSHIILPLVASIAAMSAVHAAGSQDVVNERQDTGSTSQQPGKGGHPLPAAIRKAMTAELEQVRQACSETLAKTPDDISALSRRGDANFFLGRFKAAVADYDRVIELAPSRSNSHWQRGIACFYAADYKQAAGQFERYHSFDDVDRENGIWRYLSQHKAYGRDRARTGLLKYKKDDREPFPSVYKLFAGSIEPDAILEQIRAARVSEMEREKRTFYAELYIGLNELVEGRKDSAARHLQKAVATTWPRQAGYGPHYMWQVARVQLEVLLNKGE